MTNINTKTVACVLSHAP